MKKQALIVLMIISVLMVTFSTAASPAKTATLVGVEFVQGKGLVLTFNVTGKFSKGDLNGSFYVYGDKSYNMNCQFKDNMNNTVLACVAPDKLKMFAGKNAVARFADFGFSVSIPSANYYCARSETTEGKGRVTLSNGKVVDWLYPRDYPAYGGAPGFEGSMKNFDKSYYHIFYGLKVTDWDFIFTGCKDN